MSNICPFCNINPATKTNSHIVSNFITIPLKYSAKGNRVYAINKYLPDGNYDFTQDTPKESFIFCPECESQFNLRFERHIANTFFEAYSKRNNYFDVFLKLKNVAYRVYTNTDYITFKKFLFLQLYRMHVSNLPVFANVTLSKSQLKLVHKNLFDLSFFEDIKVTIFSTDLADEKMNGIFAKALNANSYFLLMNDLLCFFEFDSSKSLFRQTDEASNYQNNSPRIVFLNPKQTKVFTNTIATLIVNSSN